MKITAQAASEDERLREAGDWLLRLNAPDVAENVWVRWVEWCQHDPGNLTAFEQMRALWGMFDDERLGASLPSPPLDSARKRPPVTRRRILQFATAATVVLGAGIAVEHLTHPHALFSITLHTDVARLHTQVLPDGSQIELGARSTVRVEFTKVTRRVTIESGEAFFSVAKDKNRPFVVQAGSLHLVAVGTAFNVRRSDERVVVTVSEGVVRVASSEVANGSVASASNDPAAETAAGQVRAGAGQQVIYSAKRNVLTPRHGAADASSSWMSRSDR
jgi:transmembrane sensor